MAAVLHGSARTTPRVRAELQASQASTRALAAQSGLNPEAVAKWRLRQTTTDAAMGPTDPRSTVLSPAEEAIIVEFQWRTLLPLDDVIGCCEAPSQSSPAALGNATRPRSRSNYTTSAGTKHLANELRRLGCGLNHIQ